MNRQNLERFLEFGGVLGFVLFAFAFSVANAQTPEEYKSSITAEHWVSMCRPLLEAKIGSDGRLEVGNTFEAGQCAEAFDAISVLASLTDKGKPVLGFCMPPSHTLTQWIAIFTDYTKRHPKLYTDSFAFVAIAAFQEAYPCAKK
jgi:hypothetical protein